MRLIDADKINFVWAPIAPFYISNNVHYEQVAFKCEVDAQPIVDAVPVVHAHWIEFKANNGNVHYKCSRCGKEVSYPYAKKRWKYCIECGAKMDEEEGK